VHRHTENKVSKSQKCNKVMTQHYQSVNLYFAQICKNNVNSCTKYTVSRTARLTMALTAALNNTNTNDSIIRVIRCALFDFIVHSLCFRHTIGAIDEKSLGADVVVSYLVSFKRRR